jgi:hypothetical protein
MTRLIDLVRSVAMILRRSISRGWGRRGAAAGDRRPHPGGRVHRADRAQHPRGRGGTGRPHAHHAPGMARSAVSAVFILWLRQLKRYFRSRARRIGWLGHPILFLLALGFGPAPTSARGDYVQFLAPGIMTMAVLFTAVFSGIEIIWDRLFGFLKETLVARCRGSRSRSGARSAAQRWH